MAENQLACTLSEIQRTIRRLAREGVAGFACSEQNLSRLMRWGQTDPEPGLKFGPTPELGPDLESGPVPGRVPDLVPGPVSAPQSLSDIRGVLGDCKRCRLSKTRGRIVFGRGNPVARLVFVGEAPGFEEDRQGEPFVGPAGRLLTKIIAAMGMTRDEVYILNVIKCRPPQNRNPLPEEVDACSPFMTHQIQSIQPDFICALGKFAAQTLLETDRPISRLRGRFYDYKGIQLMPTFHPAYLLHNPEKKREVWQDMQKLMAALKNTK